MKWSQHVVHANFQSNPNVIQGGIDIIAPSFIAGWAHNSQYKLEKILYFMGPNLIAVDRFRIYRPDVERDLGLGGLVGFELAIPVDFPIISMTHPPRILAVDEGQRTYNLHYRSNQSITSETLAKAINPSFRGMNGHFDGLSADGNDLTGWAYQRHRQACSIWLQCEGLSARRVPCELYRQDLLDAGIPPHCGFCFSLHEWPEVRGRQVYASFDREGDLPLPSLGLVQID